MEPFSITHWVLLVLVFVGYLVIMRGRTMEKPLGFLSFISMTAVVGVLVWGMPPRYLNCTEDLAATTMSNNLGFFLATFAVALFVGGVARWAYQIFKKS